MKRSLCFLLSVFVGIVLVANADSQILPYNPYQIATQTNTMVTQHIQRTMLSNQIFNNVMANEALKSGKRRTGRSYSKKANRLSLGVTGFNKQKRVLPSSLVTNFNGSKEQKTQIYSYYNRLLDIYEQTAAKDGFPSNDLAYGFEYFIVNNYIIYHNLNDKRADKAKIDRDDPLGSLQKSYVREVQKVTPLEELKIYNQFRSLLQSNPNTKKLTNAQKQQFTELLAILTSGNALVYANGVNNQNDQFITKAQEMARKSLEQLTGKSADNIVINDNGLSFKN